MSMVFYKQGKFWFVIYTFHIDLRSDKLITVLFFKLSLVVSPTMLLIFVWFPVSLFNMGYNSTKCNFLFFNSLSDQLKFIKTYWWWKKFSFHSTSLQIAARRAHRLWNFPGKKISGWPNLLISLFNCCFSLFIFTII
jgi:hypothetical protein